MGGAGLADRTCQQERTHAGDAKTGKPGPADPNVKQALSQALNDALSQATTQAMAAMTAALATLEEVRTDPDAPTGARVSAARVILDAGPQLARLARQVREILVG
jgi:hypothetical protein